MELSSISIFFGLLGLSAFFSGTETALTAVSSVTVQRLCDEQNPRARLLKRLLENKGRVIAALLVGNNIVNTALAVFATVVFHAWAVDSRLLPEAAAPLAASVSAVVFLLVFGEVLPKTVAVTYATRWSLLAAWPVRALTIAFVPATWLLNRLADFVMVLLGRKPGSEDIFDLGEIHAMANIGEQQGVIDEQEAELIQRASRLNDIRVREIMIPRTDVEGIEVSMTLDEIRAFLQRTSYSRIPVYKGDLDDIVGILHFKDFLRHAPARTEHFELINYLHKPLFVPESAFIGDLLKQMQARRTHLAIVLDEYGGTSGLITLEDVVEMLVGRIEDEYDAVSVPFEQIDETTWDVDGRVIDEVLFQNIGVQLPPEATEAFHTVAGLALTAFGNIPSAGDVTTYHNLEITALRVQGNRVRRVRVRVLPVSADSTRRPTVRITASPESQKATESTDA